MLQLGVDIGGSGIKGAIVDVARGEMVSDRIRVDTPRGFEPDAIVDAVAEIVDRIGAGGRGPGGTDDADLPAVGLGFPAVVSHGVVKSPPTAHEFEGWIGLDLRARLSERLGVPVAVVNDADVAGIAEMAFGAGRGVDGLVIIVTLGTGIGSAVFADGRLVPNTEFGKLYLSDRTEVAEQQVAERVRGVEDLTWEQYGERLHEYLSHLDRLFTPDLVIVGGGVSKKHTKFLPQVDIRCPVVPAELRNAAGIVGAAVAAFELAEG